MREQGIVKPAQGAKRRRSSNRRVIALLIKTFSLRLRLTFGEKTFVRHVTDNYKPPGVGPQFGLGSGDDNISQIRTVNIRVTGVAASHVKIQNVLGVIAHCQDGSELFFGIVVQIRRGQEIRDWLPPPQYSSFLVSGAKKID